MPAQLTLDSPPQRAQTASHTWEEAVAWLRQQPDQEALVRACYYDDPLIDAAERFAASDEWRAVNALLPSAAGDALDIGAGRGISSYALARAGWNVTALEPDPGSLVGAGAIEKLADTCALPIRVLCHEAESLPFADQTFDLVYCRQVLHHAADLAAMCREAARTLRPGGRFIATREHVVSTPDELAAFLAGHPLHGLYGGEHAFRLGEYVVAIEGAGLNLSRVLGPFDSVINYFPMSHDQWLERCRRPIGRSIGRGAARLLCSERHAMPRWILRRAARRLSDGCRTPGRLYSFVATRPT